MAENQTQDSPLRGLASQNKEVCSLIEVTAQVLCQTTLQLTASFSRARSQLAPCFFTCAHGGKQRRRGGPAVPTSPSTPAGSSGQAGTASSRASGSIPQGGEGKGDKTLGGNLGCAPQSTPWDFCGAGAPGARRTPKPSTPGAGRAPPPRSTPSRAHLTAPAAALPAPRTAPGAARAVPRALTPGRAGGAPGRAAGPGLSREPPPGAPPGPAAPRGRPAGLARCPAGTRSRGYLWLNCR